MRLSRSSSSVPTQEHGGLLLERIDLIATLLVVGRCLWIFSTPLRSGDLPLRFAQDDFYYYLKPAQNLALLHRSTFDGATLTNGYHPLYFALITVISLFVHTIPGIFRVLWLLDTVSATGIFLLTRKIFARVTSTLLANGLAIATTALCIPLLCDQMEVTLALPLGFAFLCVGFVDAGELTRRWSVGLGFLGALTFLARLDAGLLVFLYAVALLCTREFRQRLSPGILLGFVAGVLPLPVIYLWLNLHFFGTLLPVSGMAKQMRHGHRLSLLLPGSFNGTSELFLCVAIAAAVFAWAFRRFLQARERIFLFAVLATPFLFYGLEMAVSDWPIWNWYFYDLRFSAAGAFLLVAVVASRLPLPTALSSENTPLGGLVGWALMACASFVLCVQHYKVDHWMVEIQHAADVLDRFAATHPGKYAMGDRAGMFAVGTSSPVLQTEGLVMDRAYLNHIRAGDDLRSVLASYGVSYYVAFVFKTNLRWQWQGNCLHAMEPSIAGPDSLRMRSTFCQPPLLTFPGFDGEYFIYRVSTQ